MSNKSNAVSLSVEELNRATELYGPFLSAHEGYAVILEELDELKEEVFKNPKRRSIERMREEAVQVAAMAMRFIVDICTEEALATEKAA